MKTKSKFSLARHNERGYGKFELPKAAGGMSLTDPSDDTFDPNAFSSGVNLTGDSKASPLVDGVTTPNQKPKPLNLSSGLGGAITALGSIYQPKSLDPGLGNSSYFSKKVAQHKQTDQFVNTAATTAATVGGPVGAAIGAGLELGNDVYKYFDSRSARAKRERNISISKDASSRAGQAQINGNIQSSLVGGYSAPAYGKKGMKLRKQSKYSAPC